MTEAEQLLWRNVVSVMDLNEGMQYNVTKKNIISRRRIVNYI